MTLGLHYCYFVCRNIVHYHLEASVNSFRNFSDVLTDPLVYVVSALLAVCVYFSIASIERYQTWRQSEACTRFMWLLTIVATFSYLVYMNTFFNFEWWYYLVAGWVAWRFANKIRIDPRSYRIAMVVASFPEPPGYVKVDGVWRRR